MAKFFKRLGSVKKDFDISCKIISFEADIVQPTIISIQWVRGYTQEETTKIFLQPGTCALVNVTFSKHGFVNKDEKKNQWLEKEWSITGFAKQIGDVEIDMAPFIGQKEEPITISIPKCDFKKAELTVEFSLKELNTEGGLVEPSEEFSIKSSAMFEERLKLKEDEVMKQSNEIHQLKEQLHNSQSQIQNLKEEIKMKDQQIEQLNQDKQHNLQRLQNFDLNNKDAQFNEQSEIILRLSKQKDELRQEIEALQQENIKKQTKIDNFNKETALKEQKIESDMQTNATKLKREHQDLAKTMMKKFEKEKRDLEDQIAELRASHFNLDDNQQVALLQNEIAQLKKEIREREDQEEAKYQDLTASEQDILKLRTQMLEQEKAFAKEKEDLLLELNQVKLKLRESEKGNQEDFERYKV